MRELEKLSPEQRTWDKVVSVFLQDTIMEPFDEPIERTDYFAKDGTHAFKFSGAPDPAIVNEVVAWFDKLISDADVLKSTTIDVKVMARIVAQTGATIDGLPALLHKNERHEKTVVDIGVLRFPDIEKPYFQASFHPVYEFWAKFPELQQVYRIKLVAFSSSERTLAWQSDHNGITGEYNSRKFKPRQHIIDQLSQDVKAKAIKEANDLFA
ncbi:hypothetical protein FA95DRAFT_1683046 [Auriscalpium vulgare]|uniref:Uncharacterized protein n=1 Tax=Auriscalpium vulgare TaxID=40419 RepID=A0ACB8RCW3_9AGAM|nr:hypothetical protein FA95DRAFT_1683046 [Auriscalpium vulgare]